MPLAFDVGKGQNENVILWCFAKQAVDDTALAVYESARSWDKNAHKHPRSCGNKTCRRNNTRKRGSVLVLLEALIEELLEPSPVREAL